MENTGNQYPIAKFTDVPLGDYPAERAAAVGQFGNHAVIRAEEAGWRRVAAAAANWVSGKVRGVASSIAETGEAAYSRVHTEWLTFYYNVLRLR